MTNADKPIVRLWELHNLGLIVCHPSGVIYSNQVGGYSTHHPEVEGSFVPLQEHDLEFDQQAALESHFTGPKWRGHCYRGIDEETADFVDDVLSRSTVTARL